MNIFYIDISYLYFKQYTPLRFYSTRVLVDAQILPYQDIVCCSTELVYNDWCLVSPTQQQFCNRYCRIVLLCMSISDASDSCV